MRIKNRRKELITASAMVIFSLVYLYASIGIKLGTVRNPGAGFLPLLVGLGLLVCSCSYLYKVARQPRTAGAVLDEEDGIKERQFLVPAGITAVVLAYPSLLRHLYFILATTACLLALFRLLRFKGWTFSLLVALATAVVTYVLFFRSGVMLPSGAVEQFLFSLWG